ncbi:hypothetical protein ACWHAM_26525 [Paenibacillus terrae]
MPSTDWFRWTHRDSMYNNFKTGIPTFIIKQADYFQSWLIIRLDNAVTIGTLTANELDNVNPEDVAASIRTTNLYATDERNTNLEHIYSGAFPTFEKWIDDGNEVRGISFILKETADYQRIHPSELAEFGYRFGDIESQFVAIHNYASHNDFVTGLPTFTEDEQNYVGALLFKQGFAQTQEIPFLYFVIQKFNFDHLNEQYRTNVILALEMGIDRFSNSPYLSDEEKRRLALAYGNKIFIHDAPASQTEAGRWVQNGDDNHIYINWGQFLDNNGDVNQSALAETLIHEIMHVAGYSHIEIPPNAKSPGCGNTSGDEYFDSPPLRAECVIGNNQSLLIN